MSFLEVVQVFHLLILIRIAMATFKLNRHRYVIRNRYQAIKLQNIKWLDDYRPWPYLLIELDLRLLPLKTVCITNDCQNFKVSMKWHVSIFANTGCVTK